LDALASLPPVQLAAGVAEAVKHGVIADAEYFAFLEREHRAVAGKEPAVLEYVVRRSVEIKAAVVAADEREAGRRAILNFGHTVGHAVEATARFAALHGEAVAIGMAYEARLAETLGVAAPGTAARLRAALERYGLPLELPETATVDALVGAMQLDKKAREGTVRFALPAAIGTMHRDRASWTVAAPEQGVRPVLASGPGRPRRPRCPSTTHQQLSHTLSTRPETAFHEPFSTRGVDSGQTAHRWTGTTICDVENREDLHQLRMNPILGAVRRLSPHTVTGPPSEP